MAGRVITAISTEKPDVLEPNMMEDDIEITVKIPRSKLALVPCARILVTRDVAIQTTSDPNPYMAYTLDPRWRTSREHDQHDMEKPKRFQSRTIAPSYHPQLTPVKNWTDHRRTQLLPAFRSQLTDIVAEKPVLRAFPLFLAPPSSSSSPSYSIETIESARKREMSESSCGSVSSTFSNKRAKDEECEMRPPDVMQIRDTECDEAEKRAGMRFNVRDVSTSPEPEPPLHIRYRRTNRRKPTKDLPPFQKFSSIDEKSLPPYTCFWQQCLRHFASSTLLANHVWLDHVYCYSGSSSHAASYAFPLPSSTSPSPCPWSSCPTTFARAGDVPRHMNMHLGVKYQCFCGGVLSRGDRNIVERHIDRNRGHPTREELSVGGGYYEGEIIRVFELPAEEMNTGKESVAIGRDGEYYVPYRKPEMRVGDEREEKV